PRFLPSFPTRRSSDLVIDPIAAGVAAHAIVHRLLRQRLGFRIQRGHDSQTPAKQVAGIVSLLELAPDVVDEMWRQRGTVTEHRLDRKSTRLNSSHRTI